MKGRKTSERKERRNQKMRNKPHYEPPGKRSTIRSGRGWGKNLGQGAGVPQARENTMRFL